MSDLTQMKPYLETAITSSQRVRQAVYTLLVTSLLLGSVTWNVRKGFWSDLELERLEHQIECLREETWFWTKVSEGTAFDGSEWIQHHVPGCFPSQIPVDERASRTNPDRLASILAADLARSEALYRIGLSKKLDRHFFSMPALGLSFHVNDLGLIGGVSVLLLSLLLAASQSKQLEVYDYCFSRAEAESEELLRSCYQYLRLQQVLSSPPGLEELNPNVLNLANAVSKFVLFLPSLILIAVFSTDFQSWDLVKGTWASLSLVAGGTTTVLTTIAIFYSVFLGYQFDQKWLRYHAVLSEQDKNEHPEAGS